MAAKFDPSKARYRHISIEMIEKVKAVRTASNKANGTLKDMTPWDELTPKERFTAIQAYA